MSKEFTKQLAIIQQNLVAAKNQRNSFGNYNYRSCEDILEAVKPLLGNLTLTISDDIVPVGERAYIKSTATISDGEHHVAVSSFAREALTQKGMSDSQLTGATSSYARKYALNGLFLIDDNKDADTDEARGGKKAAPKKPAKVPSGDSFKRKPKAPIAEEEDEY